MKKFSMEDIHKVSNEGKIEELQNAVSNLVHGLNATSLDLKVLYAFEDMIYNNHFDLALDALKDDVYFMSNEDKNSLIFVFKNASREYKVLSK